MFPVINFDATPTPKMSNYQVTLALFKPDLVARPVSLKVFIIINSFNFILFTIFCTACV